MSILNQKLSNYVNAIVMLGPDVSDTVAAKVMGIFVRVDDANKAVFTAYNFGRIKVKSSTNSFKASPRSF